MTKLMECDIMKKIETSKIFLIIMTLLTIFIIGLSTFFMLKHDTYEPLIYIVPAVFAELGAATASYYIKAKNENKIKIVLGAVKEIQDNNEELSEDKIRVIEALVGSLN